MVGRRFQMTLRLLLFALLLLGSCSGETTEVCLDCTGSEPPPVYTHP